MFIVYIFNKGDMLLYVYVIGLCGTCLIVYLNISAQLVQKSLIFSSCFIVKSLVLGGLHYTRTCS